jgi:hypothetical protein
MEQEIPDKQPGEALREMLARSEKVASQYGVSEHKRKRQVLRIIAARCALVGFVLIMSPFVASGLATVPGAHVDDVEGFSWFWVVLVFLYVPIGIICVLLAGGLLVARASLR